ncbi:zinc ribbon domain-containing protein [Halobellus captivus]|uniref:zinc ribbon domain-containing protein n=1 Tax=Halobellus captivus TaxID=2592614 RepID=UPI0011A87547|nr:zinc ribbon domain-containing protein [Halobellus captivus]
MSRSVAVKRPWLAAVLAAVVTGLGHVYLRRWKRALGWLTVLFGVSFLLVDPSVLDELASGTVDPVASAPILLVGALSVIDAYVIARVQNSIVRIRASHGREQVHCPNCGKELDPDLTFCQWCTAELPERVQTSSEDIDADVDRP